MVINRDKTAASNLWLSRWRKFRRDPAYDLDKNTNFNSFFISEDYFTIHDDVRIESYDSEANSPLEDLMNFGFIEGRVFNKALQTDNVVRLNTILTPDSDPSLIAQTREAFFIIIVNY